MREQGERPEADDRRAADEFPGRRLSNELVCRGAVAVEHAVDYFAPLATGMPPSLYMLDECSPLTSNMRRTSCSVRSSRGLTCAIPAFATMVFRGPSSWTEAFTMFSTSCSFETSARKAKALRPRLLISETAESALGLLAGRSLMQMS